MSEPSSYDLTEDSPALAFVRLAAVTNPSTGKVHAFGESRHGPGMTSLCGLARHPREERPLPAQVDCALCVTQITAQLAAGAYMQAIENDNPAALRARIAELEAARARDSEDFTRAMASAAVAVSAAQGTIAAHARNAALWRSVAGAVMVSTGTKGVGLSALEYAAVRAGVPWAEVTEGEGGSAQVMAFLSIPAPAVSSAHDHAGRGPAGQD